GGAAEERGDITTGLPRVEEIFEARKKPRGEAIISDIDGVVHLHERDGIRYISVTDSDVLYEDYDISEWDLLVEDGAEVNVGDPLAQRGEEIFASPYQGRVSVEGNALRVAYEQRDEREYELPSAARLVEMHDEEGGIHRLRDGDFVKAGDPLTEGSKNPHRILKILGANAVMHYLLVEVQNVYRQQGVNISDKHFEVIIRRMLSKVQITRSGDTELLPGEMIDRLLLLKINEKIAARGGTPATAQPVLLGITKAALSTDSFLSASSFQHTIKVLAGAAIAGKEDPLIGLKENVIIGKLIPAGTGFHRYKEDRGAMLERHADELANSYISSRLLAQQPAARAEVVEFVDDEFDEEEFDEEFEPGDD